MIRHAGGSLVEQLRFLRRSSALFSSVVGRVVRTDDRGEIRSSPREASSAHMGAVVENALDPEPAAQARRTELDAEKFADLESSRTAPNTKPYRERFRSARTPRRRARHPQDRRAAPSRRTAALRSFGARAEHVPRRGRTRDRGRQPAYGSGSASGATHAHGRGRRSYSVNIGADPASRPDCSRVVAAVSSPLSLLHELFTVKGAGTLMKRGNRHLAARRRRQRSTSRGWSRLFESSFGRTTSTGELFRRRRRSLPSISRKTTEPPP